MEQLSNKKSKDKKIKALILTPTRELAFQIQESISAYGKNLALCSTVVIGGVSETTKKALNKGVDILVATPGRLIDLYNQKALSFSNIEILVLDEADRMLDMGFIHDIKKIIGYLPIKKQALLFSATFSNEIKRLANKILNKPIEISVSPKNITANTVKQSIYKVNKKQKNDLLLELISKYNWYQVLIFTQTKHNANRLCKFLDKNGVVASAIHGNKSQNNRTRSLNDFKSGKVQALVATDIAARGLDINELPQVINFDLPHVPEDYVHRIGRTGRAGQKGSAISLVSEDDNKKLIGIEKLINIKFKNEKLENFSYDKSVQLNQKTHKKRKFRKKTTVNN